MIPLTADQLREKSHQLRKLQRVRLIPMAKDCLRLLSVVAIEDFVALNIIEMATDKHSRFIDVLRQIIGLYNERLEEVETDMSLKIDYGR